METLRSSWMIDGTAIFLLFDKKSAKYRVGTRWYWLAAFGSVWDACEAFEVLEYMDHDDHRAMALWINHEMRRTPRSRFAKPAHRINYLAACVDKRMAGMKVRYAGSKGSIEQWY